MKNGRENKYKSDKAILRFVGRSGLLLITLLLAIVIFRPLTPLLIGEKNLTQYYQSLPQPDERLSLGIDISSADEEMEAAKYFNFKLGAIRLPTLPETGSLPSKICAERLDIYWDDELTGETFTRQIVLVEALSGRCIQSGKVAPIYLNSYFSYGEPRTTVGVNTDSMPLPFEIERSSFYFPFDRQRILMAFSLGISTQVGDINDPYSSFFNIAELYAPGASVISSFPLWEEDVTFGYELLNHSRIEDWIAEGETLYEIPDPTPVMTLQIALERPLFQRVLTVVLLASLFGFILILLFVSEISAFLEIAVGILLGLWGVQGILIPTYITGPTLIETLILTLYVLLAFVTFVRFIIIPFWYRLAFPSVTQQMEDAPIPSKSSTAPAEYIPEVTNNNSTSIPTASGNMLSQIVLATLTAFAAIIVFIHYTRNRD